MSTVESILEMIARLSPEDREKVREYLQAPRTMTIYTVPGESFREIYEAFAPVREETKDMSKEEIDDFFREVIEEVREDARAKGRD